MTAALLDIRDVAIRFGGIDALKGVSFSVFPDEICGLIGPNGAGKTTLFNAISRVYKTNAGKVTFAGHVISDLPADRIIRLGVARTFQNVALFGAMSVLDNILLGAHHRLRPTFLGSILSGATRRRELARMADEAKEILADLNLADVCGEPAGSLPFGTQKRVELARALLAKPRLLMLDEPANGLSHGEVDDLSDVILRIRERYRLTVLLVEHHMRMVMRLSDRVVVLENGAKIADGPPAVIRADPVVARAYLGTAA